MRRLLYLAFLLTWATAQSQEPGQPELLRSVYLIGNAANVPCDAPIMVGLRNLTAVEERPYIVLYSGDLIDNDGLEKTDCEDEEAKLRGMIEIALNNPQGEVLFLPGERDWDNAGESGWKKVKRLEDFLEKELHTKRALIPTKGCPGPMAIDVGDDLRIIAVNTQWFQHQYQRPGEADDCKFFNENEFYDEIDDYLEEVPERNLIIAGHHPIFSYGQSAGHKTARRHFFPLTDVHDKLYVPLPVLGTFYAGYRQNVGNRKDLTNAPMREFSRRMFQILSQFKNVMYVSAHELDLQAHFTKNNFHINSGAMEKALAVGQGPETLFKKKKRGFIKLEYFTDGKVGMKVFYLQKEKVVLGHEQLLLQSSCTVPPKSPLAKNIPINDRLIPCRTTADYDIKMVKDAPVTATITPGAHYDVGKMRRWVFGEHYRKTWATPISNIPILDLDTTFGGLTPYALGGGGQTHVLKFRTRDGQRYYFRSIDKDPALSLGQLHSLMGGVYGHIVHDLTSGQYPYGALVTDKLMDAAGIHHTSPRLVVMPDHPKLGLNRERFAGMLGRFEIRPQGYNKGVEGFLEADRVVKTYRMFQYLIDDNDHKTDAPSYAKSRLFDILVSDWDRQPDNFKFLGYGDKKAMTFYVMPKDRDRAFSLWQGVFHLMDLEFASPKISAFNYKYGDFKSLTYKGRYLDRMLLSELDWLQWKDLAAELQSDLTDEVIDNAWDNIPPEASRISKTEMTKKLKYRRDNLLDATRKYYSLMAKYVDIVGSNKYEVFEIERLPEGDVQVTVFKKKKNGKITKQLYSRLLRKVETKEIRLHGLDKNDDFFIKGNADKSILIRIIGGDGKDMIVDESEVRALKKHTLIYDHSGKDSLRLSGEAKKIRTKEPLEFTYKLWEPHSYLPTSSFTFNQDDGFGLGFGLSLKRQGFRKPGYAKKFHFKGMATTNENFWLTANADFHHVLGHWDLLLGGKMSNSERSFRNFYGLGNNTVKNDELKKADFYENHTNIEMLQAGLKRKFWRRSYFSAATIFERYWVRTEASEEQPFTIYDEIPDLLGLGTNAYLGSQQELMLHFADASYLPRKGVKFNLQHRYYFNLSSGGERFGRWNADMRFYQTIPSKVPITVGLRGGYIHAYGNAPFYYLARLGQRDNLRGYLRNRFTGERAAFLNTDVRFDLGTVETILVPFGIGIVGFHDLGKVWIEGEDADNWHQGLGGGIYLSPYNDNFNLTFSVATSEEEDFLIEFTFGVSLQ